VLVYSDANGDAVFTMDKPSTVVGVGPASAFD
jgi:hypothetical protein